MPEDCSSCRYKQLYSKLKIVTHFVHLYVSNKIFITLLSFYFYILNYIRNFLLCYDFTLYPEYSWGGKGNLVLSHSVSHISLSGETQCRAFPIYQT